MVAAVCRRTLEPVLTGLLPWLLSEDSSLSFCPESICAPHGRPSTYGRQERESEGGGEIREEKEYGRTDRRAPTQNKKDEKRVETALLNFINHSAK